MIFLLNKLGLFRKKNYICAILINETMKHKFLDENENLLYSCESVHGLKEEIIKAIKSHLVWSRNACVDHYINDDLAQRYTNNPKNGLASLLICKGDKVYFKQI
jgi:hypothetical protein